MNIIEKISGLKNTFEGKVLAVVLTSLLLVSGFNLSAYADSASETESSNDTAQTTSDVGSTDTNGLEPADGLVSVDNQVSSGIDEVSQDATAPDDVAAKASAEGAPSSGNQGLGDSGSKEAGAVDDNEAAISFEVDNAYIEVNDQEVITPTLKVKLNKELKFTALPDNGYEIVKVSAKNKETQAAVEVATVGGVSTVAAEYVDSNLVIKVETKAITKAAPTDKQPAATPFADEQNASADPENEQNQGEAPVAGPSSEPESDYYTVTLVVGDETSTVEVRHNTLMSVPEVPVDPKGQNPFHAWYQEDATQPFDFNSPITEDTTLVAVFSTAHTVTFKDYDGFDLTVISVEDGDLLPASLPEPNLPLDLNFNYWSDTEGGSQFTGPVVSDMTLYPVTSQTSIAVFITDGGPVVESQSSTTASFIPNKPTVEMKRAGYTFKYWSLEPKGSEYKFDTPVSGTTYIYAVWDEAKVGYFINFYNEKAGITGDPGDPSIDASNYELVYTKSIPATDAKAAKTGEKITWINSTIISDRSNYTAGGENVYKLLDYSLYAWDDSAEKPLSSHGDTVINVYSKRITYVFTFDLTKTTGSTATTYSILTAQDPVTGTKDYEGSYTVYGKLGQDVSDTWPTACKLKTSAGARTNFTNWLYYWSNGPRTIDCASIQQVMGGENNSYKNVNQRPPSSSPNSLQQQGKLITPRFADTPYSETRWYYTELTQQQYEAAIAAGAKTVLSDDPDQMDNPTKDPASTTIVSHYADGKTRYYQFAESNDVVTYQTSWSPQGWPGRTIEGYTTITNTGTPTLTSKYQVAKKLTAVSGQVTWGAISYYMPRVMYNVTLITSGGTIGDPSAAQYSGNATSGYYRGFSFEQAIELPNNPEKAGYTFEGWYFDENLTQKFDTDAINIMPSSNLTLYAKYEGAKIKVEYYDTNEPMPIKTVTYVDGEKLSEADLASTKFGNQSVKDSVRCWYYYTSSGKVGIANWGMTVALSNSIKVGDDNIIKLYVDYLPTTNTVTFMVPDGSGGFEQTKQLSVTAGGRSTLAKQGTGEGTIRSYDYAKTPANYYFVDWYTEQNYQSTVFTTGTEVIKNISVYAKYAPIVYTIEYVLNGGTNHSVNPSSYTVESSDIALQDPIRAGYTFAGWYTDSSLSAAAGEPAIPTGSSGNKTFYAKWIADPSKITFVTNGGSAVADMDGVTDEVISDRTMPTTTREGYTFAGWYDNAQLSGNAVFQLPVAFPVGTTTFYAKWIANADVSYIVHYYKEGTTESVTGDKVVTGKTFNQTYTESAATVAGWTYDAATKDIVLDAYDKALTFYYTANQAQLDYIANGGDGVMDPTMGVTDQAVNIDFNRFVRFGYTFTGWNTKADGSGFAYAPGDTFRLAASDNTLYAQWTTNTDVSYMVHYYEQGTTNNVAPSKAVRNQNFASSVTETAIAVDGYTLVGNMTQTMVLDAYGKSIVFYYAANAVPVDPTPVPPTNPTPPNDPGTPVTPIVPTPETPVAPNDPIAEIIVPLAEVMEEIVETVIPATTEINEDGTPLAAADHERCWVHYYILFGMLVAALYAVGVIARRRHFTKEHDAFEEEILGSDTDNQTASGMKVRPGYATN